MLLLATIPPPAVNSAPYSYYDSSSSSSSRPVASSSPSPDYYDTLSKFEPWALQEDGLAGAAAADSDGALPQFDLRSHMMVQ